VWPLEWVYLLEPRRVAVKCDSSNFGASQRIVLAC
jgi:hypothetical protein